MFPIGSAFLRWPAFLTWQTNNLLNTLNGVTLWLAFLVFRVMLFPYFFYLCFRDARDDYAGTMGAVSGIEVGWSLPVAAFLWVLSCFWALKLTRGMLKLLKGGKGGKKA